MPLYIPKDDYLIMILNQNGSSIESNGMVSTHVSSKYCSDGHHTFFELYEHRYLLWIAYCQLMSQTQGVRVWRSKLHADGTMFPDSFILGIFHVEGAQMTYHLHLDKWDLCMFATTLDNAPAYDGHQPGDVLDRLLMQIKRRNE